MHCVVCWFNFFFFFFFEHIALNFSHVAQLEIILMNGNVKYAHGSFHYFVIGRGLISSTRFDVIGIISIALSAWLWNRNIADHFCHTTTRNLHVFVHVTPTDPRRGHQSVVVCFKALSFRPQREAGLLVFIEKVKEKKKKTGGVKSIIHIWVRVSCIWDWSENGRRSIGGTERLFMWIQLKMRHVKEMKHKRR